MKHELYEGLDISILRGTEGNDTMKRILFIALVLPMTLLSQTAYAAEEEAAPRGWLNRPNPAAQGAAPPAARRHGAAGYGYRAGPAMHRNCGMYRYWDGKSCVDARDTAPPMQ